MADCLSRLATAAKPDHAKRRLLLPIEPAANREMLRPHLTRAWHRELLTRDGLMVVDGGNV